MIPRSAIAFLVTAACVLPIAVTLTLGVSRLLLAMGDAAAATVLDRVALAGGMLWGLGLLCLIVALGINSLGNPPEE